MKIIATPACTPVGIFLKFATACPAPTFTAFIVPRANFFEWCAPNCAALFKGCSRSYMTLYLKFESASTAEALPWPLLGLPPSPPVASKVVVAAADALENWPAKALPSLPGPSHSHQSSTQLRVFGSDALHASGNEIAFFDPYFNNRLVRVERFAMRLLDTI